jgi:hypothetical protein
MRSRLTLSLALSVVGCVNSAGNKGADMSPRYDLSVPFHDLSMIDFSLPPDLTLTNDVDAGCGCLSGVCGTFITESLMNGMPTSWRFNGSAAYDPLNSDGVLTPDMTGMVGSIIYQSPITTDIFDVNFDFRITHNGVHADGMGFVLLKNAAVPFAQTAIGAGGGGLGMVNPMPSGSSSPLTGFGVELDGFDNDPTLHRCGEIAGDHVNIDTLTGCRV